MQDTPRLQNAMDSARAASRGSGHAFTTSGHLLLGIISLGSGVAVHVLESAGITITSLEPLVAVSASDESGEGELGLSALEVLERAANEARRFQHTYCGVEHMTLALLAEQSGPVAGVFTAAGVSTEQLAASITDGLS
jgi:ATP-dependent Clp protease ATP-binding subunit ClpA